MALVNNMDEQRLTRIEDKLDKLTEGFSALVRMDEKLITLLKRMETYDARQERLAERVTLLERSAPIFDAVGKVAMVAIGAAVGWMVTKWMGGQ